MSEIEKTTPYKYCISVKFNGSKKSYNFGTDDETLKYGDHVVVETVRGLELGEVISDLRNASEHSLSIALKPITRKATEKDIRDDKRNHDEQATLMEKCQHCISDLSLDMNLISAEYTLDRSKIIFSYVADERVDFRELLKSLASAFKCRIELRQIGPRDKAKIVGGLGCCGMETCCSRFLDDFDIVSINMAKNQLLALNTSKLSGQCGKLMCCLKYEDDVYKEMREGLPKMNAAVYYEGEKYRITSMNILNNTARISNKESAVDMSIDDLKILCDKKDLDSVQPQETENQKESGAEQQINKKPENRQKQENKSKQESKPKQNNKQTAENKTTAESKPAKENTPSEENKSNGNGKKRNNNRKQNHWHNNRRQENKGKNENSKNGN